MRKRLAILVISLLSAACATPREGSAGGEPVVVGILAINDFHGAIEPPRQSVPTIVPGTPEPGDVRPEERFLDQSINVVQVPSGGAAYLASAIDRLRAQYEYHVTVSAGDMIGSSQLASALFLDEPTVGVMNRIGLDFNAVGNHEFDRGVAELQRLVNGGCEQHTQGKPCQLEQWGGAKFPFLAANSIRPGGDTLFPGTALKSFGRGRGKVTLGFIGITLKATDTLVSRDTLGGVTFADEADTVNALAPRLRTQGADAVIVLIHQGGRTRSEPPDPFGCANLSGDIVPILDRLTSDVDVVVSGHSHWSYVCDYAALNPAKPFLLTSAGVFGQLVTDIRLAIDPSSGRVVAKSATNLIVQSGGYQTLRGRIEPRPEFPQFQPRADIADYVARYVAATSEFIARPIGRLGGVAERPGGGSSNRGGSLGNLIADAQLAATERAGAQIAFMNIFGMRSPHQIAPGPEGVVTFGQLYSVQPFNNTLVTQTLSGAELKQMLEQGFDADQPIQFLAPSRGFTYSVDLSRPEGERVVSMKLNGVAIDPARDYRITTNSFLANGGDSFSALLRQRDMVISGTDIDALEAWIASAPVRAVDDGQRAVDLTRP